MTLTVAPPTAAELFQKWILFLDDGALTTATYVAADHPELIDPLQNLINAYLADRSAAVDETLTVADDPRDPEPVPSLPNYTVLGELGSGGMGVVYKVRDVLDQEFALKMARRGQLSEAGRARFLDEARAMHRLKHPHIAGVHHFGEHDGRPYYLMPIYPDSLGKRLAEYQSDPKKAVRLMAAVAEGVGHLHSKGFIHRDLKPHNILLTADDTPAVSDFGLVKNLADAASESTPSPGTDPISGETKPSGAKRSQTITGMVIGTRAYMAPEQAAGLTHLANPKWDVWALGVILHELLTGKRPPSSEAPAKMLNPAVSDNPPPSSFNAKIDPRLERIIRKCMARDEKERYADGGEVARALRHWHVARRVALLRYIGMAFFLLLAAALCVGVVREVWRSAIWGTSTQSGSNEESAPPDPFGADLKDNDAIDYVIANELPKGSSWQLGQVVATLRPWPTDGALTLATQRAAAVELLPARAREVVRVGARVRVNDRQQSTGRAGVYAGGMSVRTNVGVYLAVVEFGFCDNQNGFVGTGRTGRSSLCARLVGGSPDGPRPISVVHLVTPTLSFPAPRPPAGVDEEFHHLTLELTPTQVRAWFDGQFVAESSTAELAESLILQAQQNLGVQLIDALSFRPDAGAGLFVMEASGSYARFRTGREKP